MSPNEMLYTKCMGRLEGALEASDNDRIKRSDHAADVSVVTNLLMYYTLSDKQKARIKHVLKRTVNH